MGRWVDGWGPELSGFKVGFAKIRERDPYVESQNKRIGIGEGFLHA